MRLSRFAFSALVGALHCCAFAEFSFKDDGARLTVLENGEPVLVYNYARVPPPEGVEEWYGRACYVHPLFGLDGDVLTEDYPEDHYHHRGVYWAWPYSRRGDRRMDVWLSNDVHQHHQEFLDRQADAAKAEVAVRNVWTFDDAPEDPVVRETIRLTVHPADDRGRAVDFHLAFRNVSDELVTIQGQQAGNKGYGGFCLRPDSTRKPFRFTSAEGTHTKDALRVESAWGDVSSRIKPGDAVSGVAVFQHPGNPGYPHPGWLFRHYGFLGASWPHVESYAVAPGASVDLRYRLFVHRGTAEEANVAGAFAEYTASATSEQDDTDD